MNYIAIVMTEFKNSERDLYPLTKNHPLPLFPIGNKKLIVYQLEALAKVDLI
jgi:NDP-sugar pyrophosphorylase family protein